MTADTRSIRQVSLETATKLGFAINRDLPLIEECSITRPDRELVDRAFGILCLGACAYGFDRSKARNWLLREGGTITDLEQEFLSGAKMNPVPFMEQIEGLWALCWCLEVVPSLDFGIPCSNEFISLFPDLKKDEPGASFRKRVRVRNSVEVLAQCDLAYCLHWGLVHGGVPKKLGAKVKPYLIVERRHALEWALSDEDWDDVPMDT